LSSPGVKELLHFLMALMSSSFEKGTHFIISLSGISSNRLILTWQFWVELKDLWSASYKLSSSMQGQLLYWMASVAGSFLFLTQFMSSQELQFLLAISLIFPLKKFCFVFLTVPLNFFQSFSCLNCLYVSRSLQQLLSHQALECLVMLTFLECLYHILSILLASNWTMASRMSMLWIESVLRPLIELMSFLFTVLD